MSVAIFSKTQEFTRKPNPVKRLPCPLIIAIARVRERVKKGGHHVPVADIRRRFTRGRQRFVHDYASPADRWAVWNTFVNPPELRCDSATCTAAALKRMLLP